MDNLYRENILDHYKYPRNFGKLTHPTHTSTDEVVSCGDSLTMELIIKNNKVTKIAFNGTGCAISMASASLLTEYAKNKSKNKLQSLTTGVILKMLGVDLTPTRLKCALLSLEVLHKAIKNK